MKEFFLALAGFFSGIFGGMGMGGGTVLVPLLSFLDVAQKTAQAANLISFLPMSCVALCFHFKNKLVATEGILWLILPAVVLSAVGAFCADLVSERALRVLFGAYLLCTGIAQFKRAVETR